MTLNDIFGITICIPAFVVGFVAFIRFMFKMRELEMRVSDLDLGQVVEALCDDLDDTRVQLAEVQEHHDL